MTNTVLIKNIEALVDLDAEPGYMKHGYVLIEDGIIRTVDTGSPPRKKVDLTIDAKGMIALPGFVNTHHHLFQTLTRAYPPAMDAGLFDWLKALYPVWAHLDEEAVHLSTQVGMIELMLSGCTTTTDHHYLFTQGRRGLPPPRFIDIQIEAARELGMRFQPCRGSMSLGESDGGLPPDSIVQSDEEILKDSERLIDTYHDPSFGAMTRIALAPCSPFSVTPRLMQETAQLAREHNVRLHTHLAETLDEEKFCQERYGCRPLDYLESVGWLANDVWLAHGIHFTQEEISRLGRAGVAIAHCPSSNMRLGSGVAPVLALLKSGVSIGLAVDGSAAAAMARSFRMKLAIIGLEGFPIWSDGQKHNLNREIISCIKQARITLDDGDILVVTHKIVSKAEGRVIDLRSVTPSARALELAQRTAKDPQLVEVILQESKEIVRMSQGLIIAEHRLGFVCANAGVDRSNSGDLCGEQVVLLPRDPDRSAREIREALHQAFHKDVGIIISDTHGRAFRDGIIGVCIGVAGAPAMWDLRGRKDLFGYTMTSSIECIADELASAASLVMGQCDEGFPLALIKGLRWTDQKSSFKEIIRDKEKDLFR